MRLIDADVLLESIPNPREKDERISRNAAIADCILLICDAPTVNAALVRYGHWIHDINNLYGCSVCGVRETMSHKKLKRYCPNCGAKMYDGDEHDEAINSNG